MPHRVQPVVIDGKSTQLNRDLQRNLNADMVAVCGLRRTLNVQCVKVNQDKFRSNATQKLALRTTDIFGCR